MKERRDGRKEGEKERMERRKRDWEEGTRRILKRGGIRKKERRMKEVRDGKKRIIKREKDWDEEKGHMEKWRRIRRKK